MSAQRGNEPARLDPITDIVCELPKLCTRAETAGVLRKGTRTIDRLIERGILNAIRVGGGHPLVPRTEIERALRLGARSAA